MTVPIKEFSRAEYPEDPANHGVHHGQYVGRRLELKQKGIFVYLNSHCPLKKTVVNSKTGFILTPLREGARMKWMQFLTPVAGMDAEEAKAYMRNHKEGTYTLLDVRQPSEYEKGRIPGAKLIPLPELAGRIGEMDSRKPVIAY
jgi:hypothetical protein